MSDQSSPTVSIQSGIRPNIDETILDGASALPVLEDDKDMVDTSRVGEIDADDKIKDVLSIEQGAKGVNDAEDHESQEAVIPQGLPAPYTPSEAEVANHNLTHPPYRNRCPICVRGKGKAAAHRCLETHREVGVPVISIDYAFLCDSASSARELAEAEGEPIDPATGKKLQPLLVLYDARTRGIYAHSVERKGPCLGVCKLFTNELDGLGYRRIVLKSDGEPSLKSFTDTLTRAWTGEVVPERSRKWEAQSNGEAGRAIQTLSAQTSTMKLALEARVGAEVADDAPIISWLIEYAAVLLRRNLFGVDGRTAYERPKGRGDRRWLIEFGESVLYRQLKGSSHQPRPPRRQIRRRHLLGHS